MASAAPALSIRFGSLLKRYRRAAGLSQEELAERAGYSVGHISKLETSIRMPSPATAELVADALELSASERSILLRAARQHMPMAPVSGKEHVGVPPLVNRQPELALLDDLLTDVDAPAMLLFASISGMGKSRLLIEAAERAQRLGWMALEGESHRFNADGPYTPVLAALADCVRAMAPEQLREALTGCSWLGRLLPELADAGMAPMPATTLPPEHERRLIFASVRRFLSNIAGPAGTLLILDNLQWASEDALALIAALLHDGDGMPLRVVGAIGASPFDRQAAISSLVADLAEDDMVTTHTLPPLAPEASRQLMAAQFDVLERRGQAVEASVQDELLRRASGIPLAIVSYAKAVRESIDRELPVSVPSDVLEAVRAGMRAAPDVAQQVLQVVALAGEPIRREAVVAVASKLGHSELEVAQILDRACENQVLKEQEGRGYIFMCEALAEGIQSDLGSAEQAYLHREIAAALARQRSALQAPALAMHHLHAGEADEAAPYLARAGLRAEASHAYLEAARYYDKLAQYQDAHGNIPAAARAHEHLGRALGLLRQHVPALSALAAALTEYRAAGDRDAQGRIAAQMVVLHASSDPPDEALAHLQRDLSAAEALPDRDQALMHVVAARLYRRLGHCSSALQEAEHAATLARAARDQPVLTMAELERGIALDSLGRGDTGLNVLEETVLPLAATGDDPWLENEALTQATHGYITHGAFDKARRAIARRQIIAERVADPLLAARAALASGVLRFYMGSWSEAQRDLLHAGAALRRLERLGSDAASSAWLSRLALARGHWSEATRYQQRTMAAAARAGDESVSWPAQYAFAEHALLEGRVDDAFVLLHAALEQFGIRDALPGDLLSMLAWAHLERGNRSKAETLIAESIRDLAAAGAVCTLVDAQCVAARIALRNKNWRLAAATLDRATGGARQLPYPYAEAKVLYVRGLLHALTSEPEQARERWQEALTVCRRLGERLYALHIERAIAGWERAAEGERAHALP
jgi:transcriptional regulator with XRE-family HTH domain/tetratricopeptide (TPR) repeat protein